jgi:CheY-like chemotaxis protein
MQQQNSAENPAEDRTKDPIQKLKVLVVEDSADNRLLIGHSLKVLGVQKVDYAFNGLEGVQKATNFDYDVILMDLSMPIMDGYTATNHLREKGFRRPIIAITANAIDAVYEKARALKAGFTDYLIKPLDRRLLVENFKRMQQTFADGENS